MRALLLLLLPLVMGTISLDSKSSFTSNLMAVISKGNWQKNQVYSPISIRFCLGLLYLGANGNTAAEMQDAVQLSSSKEAVVHKLLNMPWIKDNANATLSISNTFFVDNELEITEQFKHLADISHLDIKIFERSETRVNKNLINGWVKERTRNVVRNFITGDDDDADWVLGTTLINEVYFKAKWSHGFPKERTARVNTDQANHQFEMMVQDNVMQFGVLYDINAYGALLKLQDTDISMLVLRPERNDGLAAMLEALSNVDVTQLPKSLHDTKVTLMLPKFKVETDITLKRTLQQLNIRSLFYNGDFSGIFSTDSPHGFTDIRHKTIFTIDEEGIEVATVTGVEVCNGHKSDSQILNNNFFFALMDEDTVYFAGHVGKA